MNPNQGMSAACLNSFEDAFQLCHLRIQFYSKSVWGVLIVSKALDWILRRRQRQETHPQGRERNTKTQGADKRFIYLKGPLADLRRKNAWVCVLLFRLTLEILVGRHLGLNVGEGYSMW